MKRFYDSYNKFLNEELNSETVGQKYGFKLDETCTKEYLEILDKVFGLFKTEFIDSIFTLITFSDIGACHGEYEPSTKKLTINPSIFDYKSEYGSKDNKYPSYIHTLLHEIGHAIDNFRISLDPSWLSISDWKQLPIQDEIPKGYERYIEKRNGRSTGDKNEDHSDWIYKKDTEFVREYSKKTPFEDFADSFSFAILKFDNKFKGETGKKKLEFMQNIIKDKIKEEKLKEL